MNWEKATKQQLLTICLEENCPVIYKFEAANEYKRRDEGRFREAVKQARIVRNKRL